MNPRNPLLSLKAGTLGVLHFQNQVKSKDHHLWCLINCLVLPLLSLAYSQRVPHKESDSIPHGTKS